ncbi:unnamed protein product, partial [Ixodes persulcatus]
MYNLELFSSVYNGDYLFTAAAIRNAYKFAYDSCLYVPRGVATAELRALKKREVLLGVRQPSISDVVNDINNVKTSSVVVYLDGTVRKQRGSSSSASGGVGCLKGSKMQEDVVERIAESVESTVKSILPRLCETIGIPNVIANAMTATKKIRVLDVIRTVDNVLFQHSDWEERINRAVEEELGELLKRCYDADSAVETVRRCYFAPMESTRGDYYREDRHFTYDPALRIQVVVDGNIFLHHCKYALTDHHLTQFRQRIREVRSIADEETRASEWKKLNVEIARRYVQIYRGDLVSDFVEEYRGDDGLPDSETTSGELGPNERCVRYDAFFATVFHCITKTVK